MGFRDATCIISAFNNFSVLVLSHINMFHFHSVLSSGPGSLCSHASIIDVPFGEDLMSGCILRLGLAELQNCSILRDTLLDELGSLVPSDAIGKKGNANVTISDDWAPLFR